MINDVLKTSSVSRLVGLINSRYGKGLSLSFLNDTSSKEILSQSPSMVESDLRIPITCNDKYLATATVSEAGDLSREEQIQICHLVRMILQPVLYNQYLMQKPVNDGQIFEGSKNIVTMIGTGTQVSETFSPRLLETNFIFLQSSSELLLQKVSNIVHEFSARLALLPIDSIAATVKTSADLIAMGDVTICVTVENLRNPEIQNLILNYTKSTDRNSGGPLLLIQSALVPKDLAHSMEIETELLQCFIKNLIECHRLPQDLDMMTEALELLLEVRG
jgi:hypothetical protein